MTDQLEEIYKKSGKLDRYFDRETPVELWRGQKRDNLKSGMTPMHPDLFGFTRKDGLVRFPDVKVFERESDGVKMVKGCRCMAGEYRGVSTADVNPMLGPAFEYFLIPQGTEIPKGLAVTKDSYNRRIGGHHYTVAPKDDMPLSLFLVWLQAIESKLKKVKD